MTNPALDIATELDGNSAVGLTIGTDLFVGQQRDVSSQTPKNSVFIFGNSGVPPIRSMGEVEEIRRVLINIRVRWSSFEDGDTKIRVIMNFLQALEISGYISSVMLTESEPLILGQDGQGLHMWSLGAEIVYREVA